MDHFDYKDGRLHCEDVPVEAIVSQLGSPVYVYSRQTLVDHYRRLADAFAPLQPTICYAVKTLGNIHVLKLLAEQGSGFDIVSLGELARVLHATHDPSVIGRVVFAGVGKTDAEILEAISAGIGMFNVESEEEFENISRLAARIGRTTRAALRVNPDVFDKQTHRYTTTGKKGTKFGVDIDRAPAFFAAHGTDEQVALDAVHLHIGSPIYSAEPYVEAITRALELIDRLRVDGHAINALNIGGGFAADYEEGKSPAAADYAEKIVPLLQDRGLDVLIEPGRHIACNAGVLLTKVLYDKQSAGKRFAIVDAAMTDLLRPALYEAEHVVYPATLPDGEQPPVRKVDYKPPGGQLVDIVGGVCETTDTLAAGRCLPELHRGDLLAIFSAGAYGFVMASQYNARPRPAEVLVSGGDWRVIRRRETTDDLIAHERAEG
ncbi:MAG: diaminopimelate decarboxylase [Planctomycetes bacterium]|jgi:diaminopimelate decarboxylase|nr:diaminopimelate decarboxylase [Planctomycetota bacterium]